MIPYNYNNAPAISIFLDKLTYLNTILSLGESNNNFISFDIVNTIVTNNIILSSHSDFIINDFQQIESLGYSLYIYRACQMWFTLGWKSTGWTQRWVDLWNNLGFSLYAVLSVYYVVITSDDGEKSEMGVSAKWCVTVEYQKLSSIRDYLHWLSD